MSVSIGTYPIEIRATLPTGHSFKLGDIIMDASLVSQQDIANEIASQLEDLAVYIRTEHGS